MKFFHKNLFLLIALLFSNPALSETVRYQHTDMLGSVVAESDSAGNITSRSHYEPFGKRLGGDKAGIGYTGHLQDEDLNLTYMQARYYDPLIGRFYANDPIGFRDVHSFNRYSYANNNPYKYVDPDGKTTMAACAAGPFGCGVGLAITGLTILAASGDADVDEAVKLISEGSFDTKNVGTNPTTGEPGCISTCNGKTGKAKQIRIYGQDGKPETDIDVDHHHDGKKPHAHDWKEGRRSQGDEVRDVTPNEQKLIDDLIIPIEPPETSE